MSRWERVRLGDVCEKGSSGIAQKDLDGNEGPYPIYGAGGLIKHVDFYQQDRPCIAVVKDGAGVGRVTLLPGRASVIGTMQYILPRDHVELAYLYYGLTKLKLGRFHTGATIPHIYFKDYQEEQIPLPPLPVQRAIAAALGQAAALIALRKRQLEKLDLLVKARFAELFGDPVRNEMGWACEPLEKHADVLTGHPFDSGKYTETGIKICGGLIVMPDRIAWESAKHWESAQGLERYLLEENDIVLAMDRPWISGGFKIAKIARRELPALLIQRTARVRGTGIGQAFLFWMLNNERFRLHCKVTETTVPHISIGDIKKYEIFLPPLPLRQAFARFVEQTQAQKQALMRAQKKLQLQYDALMQKYFM